MDKVELRQVAIGLIQSVQDSSTIEMVSQTSERFQAAFDLYSQRLDQSWSPTDRASFCIMQQQSIQEALAYVSEALYSRSVPQERNRHFEQAGFIALLR